MIELEKISKTYQKNGVFTEALKDINMIINDGEMISIMGRSGSGKTTLLNILGGMDLPTSGKYEFSGEIVSSLSPKTLEQFRKNHVSFVFQNFALINNYSAYENIEMPLVARDINRKERKLRVNRVLKDLEIDDISKKYPLQLSGGQQQRVALARALVTNSDLIIADEPTGSLDSQTANVLMDIFESINKQGKTIVIATHDENVAKRCSKIYHIKDGLII